MEDKNEGPPMTPEGEIDWSKLTQGQKKKLKAKLKKEEEEKAAAASGKAPVAATPAAKGKAKPMNAAAKLAQERAKLVEEARIEEERLKKEAEAELKALEEKELAEERRLAEEAKNKKQIEADRIQDLKDKGLWKSKKQIKEEKARDAKRKQLIADGIIQEDEANDSGDDDKKGGYKVGKSKNKKPKKTESKPETPFEAIGQKFGDAANQEEKQEEKKQEIVEVKQEKKQEQKEDSECSVDDWENEDFDNLAEKVKAQPDKAVALESKDDELLEETKQEQQETKQISSKSKVTKKKSKQEEETEDLFSRTDQTKESKADRLARREKEKSDRIAAKKALTKKMRRPIICIMGHVDTGKTLILDKLRKTNIQAGEAGGITQQIGATYFPREFVDQQIEKTKGRIDIDLQLPGFLIIDTPGHESFTNLRNRGSSLCDFAILVVDIMHGLEQQTLESMELLRQKKCPFIIALNKIDRLYDWKKIDYANTRETLETQKASVQAEFRERVNKTIALFSEQGLNAALYWENDNLEEYLSMVPTSAITGEGLPDLMTYLCSMCQERIPKQLYEKNEFESTVLEVKIIEGHGTTIDIVLVNGVLKVGDTIILQGFNGPIVTHVKALLTPQPLKEIRVKAEYIHHQKIKGAMGIKISAPGLEDAIAGSELLKANNQDEIDDAVDEMKDLVCDIMDKYVDKTQDGVCVQASTLGSLEALLEFLKTTAKVPVSSITIGPVHKKDVLKATKVLAQKDEAAIQKEYASILAFDVKVTPEAAKFAEEEGVKIFTADIIYNLFDAFTEYVQSCKDARKDSGGTAAIFPCLLEAIKENVFNMKAPIIMGVNVKAGILKVGTPLCIPEKDNLKIGVVESIEKDRKSITTAHPKDGSVAVRISGQPLIQFGRHFDETNQICSWLTRKSLDSLKKFFREEMTDDAWKLAKKLKTTYGIE